LSIGQNGRANGDYSVSLGNGSSSDFLQSVAIGRNAATYLTNQFVFGTTAQTYVLPGITSSLSTSRQVAPTGIVTTNAAGELASDNTFYGASFGSLTSISSFGDFLGELDARLTDGIPTAGQPPAMAAPVSFNMELASIAPEATATADIASAPVTELPGSDLPLSMTTEQNTIDIAANRVDIDANTAAIDVNTGNIATNTAGIATNAEGIVTIAEGVSTNSAAITTNSDAIALNTTGVSENRTAIASNTSNISANAARIGLAETAIQSNASEIVRINEEVSDLSSGLAAVASLPDMYLSPNAKWSAAGGVGFYGDDVGVGATLAVRGNDNWAFGASVATAGEKTTGKVQVRYEGF